MTVSYDEPHGPSLCPEPFNYMYDGFKFDSCPNFEDDLSQKPFMQRLWAGKKSAATEEEINKPSDGLSLFLGCNSFVDYEIGRVLDKIREVAPEAMVIFTFRSRRYAWSTSFVLQKCCSIQGSGKHPIDHKGWGERTCGKECCLPH